MTFRPSAPHKTSRWITTAAALLVMLSLFGGTVLAVTLADAPTFTNTLNDQDGADDEPGQKDLNSHASATDSDGFWVRFNWDVTGVTGKNTADGCSLFDTSTPADGFVDAAICVTAGTRNLTLQTVTLYTCSDGRIDRCTNPDVVENIGGTQCFVTNNVAADFFHPGELDAQATCLIDLAAINSSVTPVLVNTCSYPSQEPNSDPSDCVVRISIQSGITTVPRGTTTWTATLNDIATVTPTGATGTVTFRLYSDSACTTEIWESSAIAVVTPSTGTITTTADSANSVDAGETGSNVISSATPNVPLVYYWTAEYQPTAGTSWTPYTTACGEDTTITPPTVSGISE
jgi:hypothetical protein